MSWLRMKWEDFKAWRRGETRIKAGRGRVYAKIGGATEGLAPAPRLPTATITAKVTRANGSIEFHEATNVRVGDGRCSSCGGPIEPSLFDEEMIRCVGCKRAPRYCNCGGQ